jgi:hypothetical protein
MHRSLRCRRPSRCELTGWFLQWGFHIVWARFVRTSPPYFRSSSNLCTQQISTGIKLAFWKSAVCCSTGEASSQTFTYCSLNSCSRGKVCSCHMSLKIETVWGTGYAFNINVYLDKQQELGGNSCYAAVCSGRIRLWVRYGQWSPPPPPHARAHTLSLWRLAWRFVTMFTRALHCSPSTRLIQSTLPHHMLLRSVLILSTHFHLGLPSGLFPSGSIILYEFYPICATWFSVASSLTWLF